MIGANGRLTGYITGGLKRKEWLLSQERALSQFMKADQQIAQLSIFASSHES